FNGSYRLSHPALWSLRNDPALEGKIDWQAVEQKFQSWDYKSQGLTEAGAALVALLAAAVTGPVTGVASNISGGVSAGLGVTGNAAMASAISAGVKSLIGKSSVALVNNQGELAAALVNNQGELAAALKEMGSSSNLRSLATNMVTAGLVTQVTN